MTHSPLRLLDPHLPDLTRRRALALGCAGLAAALGLTGCSAVLPEADVSAPSFAAAPSGTIRFWCRSVAFTPAQLIVEKYHAAQSAVRVELTVLPEGQMVTKLATAIRANAVPDVVAPDSVTTPVFSSREALTDLTPLIQALPYADRLNRPLLDVASYDGKVYGLPALSNVSQLFWNKRLYEQAGLDPEQGPTDFDQYLTHARALQRLDGVSGVTFTGNSAGILGYVVQPHFWADESPFYDGVVGRQSATVAGNEPLRRTLELYRTFEQEGLAQPGASADSGTAWGKDFLDGTVGLFPGSYDLIVGGATPEFLGDLGVSAFPGPDGGVSQFSGGAVLSIPRGARNPEAAWDFMRFVTELEQQSELAALGWYPVRDDVLETGFVDEFPLMVPGMERMNEGFAAPTTLYTQLTNTVQSPWLAMFRGAVFGDDDLDAVLDRGQEETARVLEVNQA
ncbi:MULTISPECIES: ABC transporter substrate-binding protein [unclassified Rathayibacter]|uniref:ABC transporter substrate-binding protein n=1 Tax=unclassified Rathayibacter TaxID=2609250 RepID=UPI000F4BCE4E|nr:MULTISPECIES: sugar ABC transporter substrate-binding protein [unclassified Rathayibacter]ROP50508.1 multiple sugar transport system substrate-binding protein [Rathayibacter sp. PhB186]ROS53467.1 multiple sugar transport system substrate-binding protein [Rathayibacter sp. PhB185]